MVVVQLSTLAGRLKKATCVLSPTMMHSIKVTKMLLEAVLICFCLTIMSPPDNSQACKWRSPSSRAVSAGASSCSWQHSSLQPICSTPLLLPCPCSISQLRCQVHIHQSRERELSRWPFLSLLSLVSDPGTSKPCSKLFAGTIPSGICGGMRLQILQTFYNLSADMFCSIPIQAKP